MVVLEKIDSNLWLSDLSRRVQHYGWRYDYRTRKLHPDSYLGPLPDFLSGLCQRIKQEQLMEVVPDQVIVNEYLPGQGIAPHIDCEPCFGPEIATISLGDEYPMNFRHTITNEEFQLFLPVGSICVLSGESRYLWTHEIAKRKSDLLPGGGRKARLRRVSVTFRSVLVSL
ncbi:MAG: alpha-ketoglutarate-dependent dioxygenase AlkB [Armatimonadota bacterium]